MNATLEDDAERDDAQRMLQEAVADFVSRATSLRRVRALRQTEPGFDRALWESLAAQGWLGIHVPQAYGGQGLGFRELGCVARGLGGALMPEPFTACAVLATGAVLHGDNAALRQSLLPRMVAGRYIVALAWQAELASTGLAPGVSASRVADGLVLDGRARFVTPAAGADAYIVAARQAEGIGLYHVPADAPGLALTLELRADGTWSGALVLRAVPVADAAVVATPRAGAQALQRALDEAAVIAGAELLGCQTGVLDLTLDYLKTRVQFGVPIGSFQALQHRTVDLWIQKELSAGLLEHVLAEFDKGVSPARRSALAARVKARCSDAGIDIARECIRLHGAIGFTDEYDAGLYLKRALVLAAWLGNGQEQRRRFDESRTAQDDATQAAAGVAPANLPGTPGERPADTDWNALSDEQFRLEAAAFFEKHYPQHLRFSFRTPSTEDVRGFMQVSSRLGWLAPAWPRRWGGMALSPAKQLIFYEERERIGAVRVVEQGVTHVAPMLMKFGSPEQQQAFIPKILSAEHLWCQGYSEPNAGSDLASLQTRAERDGDEWVINGAKIWTSRANQADYIYVLARTSREGRRQAGITFFLVDMRTPGITVRPIRTLPGDEPFCQTFFDNVRVPAKNIVGQVDQGWTIAKGLLGFERLNAGNPRRVEYVLHKVRGIAQARGLWADADFRGRYTRLEMDLFDLGTVFARYADVVATGGNPGPGISMLKIWASETYMRLNGLLVEASGAAGGLAGDLQFGDTRVDVLSSYCLLFPTVIASGTNDIQRNVLAKRVLGLG